MQICGRLRLQIYRAAVVCREKDIWNRDHIFLIKKYWWGKNYLLVLHKKTKKKKHNISM